MKALLAFIVVVGCFSAHIDAGKATSLIDITHRSYMCVIQGLIVLMISRGRWAVLLAVMEAFLLVVNLTVSYHWPTSSLFDNYYSQIQQYTFMCELLIILGVGMSGGVKNSDLSGDSGLRYRYGDQ